MGRGPRANACACSVRGLPSQTRDFASGPGEATGGLFLVDSFLITSVLRVLLIAGGKDCPR